MRAGAPRAVLALAAAALLVAAGAPAQAAAPGTPAPRTPIRHLIMLMQENHSFDNYFGTYPGADGIPAGVCMPVRPDKPAEPSLRP